MGTGQSGLGKSRTKNAAAFTHWTTCGHPFTHVGPYRGLFTRSDRFVPTFPTTATLATRLRPRGMEAWPVSRPVAFGVRTQRGCKPKGVCKTESARVLARGEAKRGADAVRGCPVENSHGGASHRKSLRDWRKTTNAESGNPRRSVFTARYGISAEKKNSRCTAENISALSEERCEPPHNPNARHSVEKRDSGPKARSLRTLCYERVRLAETQVRVAAAKNSRKCLRKPALFWVPTNDL